MADTTSPITTVDFFYDGQIRRFLMQIVRAFSGFQYQTGVLADGSPETRVVPCRMATQNRQVGHILQNNSENTLTSCPLITVFIKGVEINRERVQSPSHVSTVHVSERDINPTSGEYTANAGHRYTVERRMPHPLDATIQVDIWTNNEMQKHQLFEQIFMMFNTGFDIQSSDNPVDWTALTTMTLEDITWSSRAIPIGTNNEIDILSFDFKLPMWITPPAKVKQQRLIEQVITNIHNNTADVYFDRERGSMLPDAVGRELDRGNNSKPDHTQVRVAEHHQIEVSKGIITLLGADGEETDRHGNVYNWMDVLNRHGQLVPAHSILRLVHTTDDGYSDLDVIGYIQLGSEPNKLVWQVDVDTLPKNTLPPVNAVINPLTTFPGATLPNGTQFPNGSNGQTYLLTEDVAGGTAWGSGLNASAGDIIQRVNGKWTIIFDASECTTIQFVTNITSGVQMKFDPAVKRWQLAIDGCYYPEFWRLQM